MSRLALACVCVALTAAAQAAPPPAQPPPAQPPPAAPPPAAPPPAATRAAAHPPAAQVEQVLVTASTRNLVGRAATASEGSITAQEVRLHPIFRPGQLLETIPGLEVTSHAGEGKANQYLLRGLNLDHGTDLATFVDDMPVNMPSHGHGQGYTDLNFLIPETVGGIDYTEGPYYAPLGDFGAVGSDHIRLADTLPNQIGLSAGTLGDQRAVGTTSLALNGTDRLIAAAEIVHYNGPWKTAEHFRKYNVVLRYVHGTAADGESVTAQYYYGAYRSTIDQPARAVEQGLIPRFGTLDPADGGRTERFSVIGHSAHPLDDHWRYEAWAYAVRYAFLLRNDFTHFLADPVNGDENRQDDQRTILGGTANLIRDDDFAIGHATSLIGAQIRYDDIQVSLGHDRNGMEIGGVSADHIRETGIGIYAQNMMHWTPWFRTVLGLRGDFYRATDDNIYGGISGTPSASIFEPKGSLIFGPWRNTELYVSVGQGFHSNDVRDGTSVVLGGSAETGFTRSPLLVKQTSGELGLRSAAIPRLQLGGAFFVIRSDSELTYDGDVGTTTAGSATRRYGVDLTSQYRPAGWVELRANFAITHGRNVSNPAGQYIPDAPDYVGSFGALVDHLGPWFGGAELRLLGPHPLIEDDSQRARGYAEVNLDAGYAITEHLRAQLNLFNLFDTHGAASEYYYVSRLPGEPADGVGDHNIHPLEPRSARFSITATF